MKDGSTPFSRYNLHLCFVMFYSILILAELGVFVLIVKGSKLDFAPEIYTSACSTLFFGQWYLIDGLLNENAFQVVSYAFFFVFITGFVYVGTGKYGAMYFTGKIIMGALLVISVFYMYFYIRQYYSEFLWLYYKRIGGSVELKSKLI